MRLRACVSSLLNDKWMKHAIKSAPHFEVDIISIKGQGHGKF